MHSPIIGINETDLNGRLPGGRWFTFS